MLTIIIWTENETIEWCVKQALKSVVGLNLNKQNGICTLVFLPEFDISTLSGGIS